MDYKHTIIIKAEISKVWDALINPVLTKQYMFGCEAISDWKIGHRLIWRGAADGVHYVVGKVVEFQPNSILAFTVFDPHAGYADIPDNYLTSKYVLTYAKGETTVHISQGDYSKVEDGKQRFEEAAGGWEMAMQGLKKLLQE